MHSVSRRDDLLREPWAFDLLGTLRLIERSHPELSRIGDSAVRSEEYVGLGENAFLEFPASTIEAAVLRGERIDLFVRFLGLLGPQGPLPLHVTDEVFGWQLAGHDAYSRFLNILNHRFLQLFFRAWADARPIAQADRPSEDRFLAYIGSAIGIGSPVLRGRDSVSDRHRLGFAGLLAPTAKSASRLAQAVEGLFGIRCEVEEFVGTFLTFEVADRNRLGQAYSCLGIDFLVGASVYSVEDKIQLNLYAASLHEYKQFLPNGQFCVPLADFLYSYLGSEFECDVELALRNRALVPFQLTGAMDPAAPLLGYTTWLPKGSSSKGASSETLPEGHADHPDTYRGHARFNPAERAQRVPGSHSSAVR
nr:type VI secretion system baseplate subunit TssG [Methylobacterium sp. 37f]